MSTSSKQITSQNQTPNTNTTSTFYKNTELENFIESNYVSIKDGETKVLQFVADKTKVIEKPDFTGKPAKRAQFTVIEINDVNRKERLLELSRLHAGKIYDELKKGKTILEISRNDLFIDQDHLSKYTNQLIHNVVKSSATINLPLHGVSLLIGFIINALSKQVILSKRMMMNRKNVD